MKVEMLSCENSDERPKVLDDALKDTTGWTDVEYSLSKINA